MSEQLIAYPVLPLRDIVVFPKMICPLFVGRSRSIRALEQAAAAETDILLTAQRDPEVEDPEDSEVYETAVLASILQFLKIPDGTIKVLVEGQTRMTVDKYFVEDGSLKALAAPLMSTFDSSDDAKVELKVLVQRLRDEFKLFASRLKSGGEEILKNVLEIRDPGELADAVAAQMNVDVPSKQAVLEMRDIKSRVAKALQLVEKENQAALVEKKVKRRVKSQMSKSQREYYLNEQMKAIQRELGDADESSEIDELQDKIDEVKLSKEAREKALGELKKLKSMGNNVAEASVIRSYLDWLLTIPWGLKRDTTTDLAKAEEILDRDHYGLKKVKERLVEYIAVQQRIKKVSGPILCLVGPPGVGKTSLGQSAAEATGRDFLRISLGGVGDEAEIRGHRRTYIGSMPGRIIQSLKKAKSTNPLMLLDEVDKLGNSFRSDPASALLEVLDPEQNSRFVDRYLDVDYDLSDVLFITTANYIGNIPEPLLDRMEVISLEGYTEDEKIEIAKRHLIPKQRKAHGVKASEFKVKDRAIEDLVRVYTREAGVRNLEREIAKLARKSVTKLAKEEIKSITVSTKSISQFLGPPKFRFGLAEELDSIGVVTGLAWTPSGGDLLSIEATATQGKGRMKTTGKLGDVMKESIQAASTYVQSISPEIGFKPTGFSNIDIHVHVPEGAMPKDGPSAGVAMVTAIVSVLTGIKVRRTVAMTGEVTLRGNVLPIGGLKSKLLAAARGGIETVLIPERNLKDLSEIPESVTQSLNITPVSNVSEVLELALTQTPERIEWDMELGTPDRSFLDKQHETVSVAKH